MTDGLSIRDRGTVAAAIRGDADAMRSVWQQNRRWVGAVLMAHKPREVEVEDLLQDVAMSFVKTIGTLRDESSLRPWLRTVAINAARASGRRSKRLRLHGEVATGGDAPDAPPAVDAPETQEHEEARRLMDLALTLPEGYREPLLLKCVRGLSYRVISELLGLPETTIETRIARGRRMLRDLAKDRGASPPAAPPSRSDHNSAPRPAGPEFPSSATFDESVRAPWMAGIAPFRVPSWSIAHGTA